MRAAAHISVKLDRKASNWHACGSQTIYAVRRQSIGICASYRGECFGIFRVEGVHCIYNGEIKRRKPMRPASDSESYRNECLRKAESCLEQATRDEARRNYWIDQAHEWLRRSRDGFDGNGNASTHEICDGRLIAKPLIH